MLWGYITPLYPISSTSGCEFVGEFGLILALMKITIVVDSNVHVSYHSLQRLLTTTVEYYKLLNFIYAIGNNPGCVENRLL